MRARIAAPARRALDHQLVRFLLTGGLNTLFGYAFYLLGLAARLSPELALLVATCTGALFNYFTTAALVFRHRTLSRLIPFVSAYALVYLVNAGAIRLLLEGGFSPALAQALLVPAMAALSLALFRFFVFRPVRPS